MCFNNVRKSDLGRQVRRQLEYSIAASKGLRIVKAPSTVDAVKDIFRTNGLLGLYTGFRLHFGEVFCVSHITIPTHFHAVRDTFGTALYFFEYDGLRHIMGRLPSGEQGPTPSWLPIHSSLVPFLCGSVAGVSSWALIYPLDVCVRTIGLCYINRELTSLCGTVSRQKSNNVP